MKSSEIRQAFFDYFAKRNHQVVASSSLVPAHDPTLLFTNAGMVQFKETFLGLEARSYRRAVSAQRCVRAGGKHNDLENVGYTARHHTFFEMLGNFSFGDYFKQEAIRYAWEFLTQVLKLPPERLWITVYKDDDEAADIWLKDIGISCDRFSRCGDEDNFWSMGDTGPCGPCTEIFYDHGDSIPGGPPGSPEAEGDRYIEIWNLVFMQYNRNKEGQLHPLPKPSVDTGMGLERIAAVVQGVHNNYHIDSFQHLIHAIAKLADIQTIEHPSLKVIADHIRACSFLINDGVLPGNEGRGYVLRRIIRRAVRHGHKLGLPTPFFYQLVQPLIDVMGEAYPELNEHKTQIEEVLIHEENQFARTLSQGLLLLQEHMETLSGQVISGEVAFKLYDTYGFPVDLTADIAREQGFDVEMERFEQCMQQQRLKSQASNQFQSHINAPIALDKSSEFLGYDHYVAEGEIEALLIDGVQCQQVQTGQKAAIVLTKTPFYAESGGQAGDKGILSSSSLLFRVDDTQRMGSAIVHLGTLEQGRLSVGQVVSAQVDKQRRNAIRLNHTATHLLHAALKNVLGDYVQQKGSLVESERARFDFSYPETLTLSELQQIESLVNQKIRDNEPVVTDIMALEDAKQSGAQALFGEKYDEQVRVLTVGDFSKELCGGTHVKRTGDIGLFKIVAEYGIASGVRRIEMVTGEYALRWLDQQLSVLHKLTDTLKASTEQAPDKLVQILNTLKQKEKEVQRIQLKLTTQSSQSLLDEVKRVNGVNVLIKQLENVETHVLRTTLDQLKSRLDNAIIILYQTNDGSLSVVAGISKALLGQVPSAVDFVRHVCGRGGGRDDMAQGGGKIPADLEGRIASLPELLAVKGDT